MFRFLFFFFDFFDFGSLLTFEVRCEMCVWFSFKICDFFFLSSFSFLLHLFQCVTTKRPISLISLYPFSCPVYLSVWSQCGSEFSMLTEFFYHFLSFSLVLFLYIAIWHLYSILVWNVYAGVWAPEMTSYYAISSSTFQYNST